MSGRAPCSGDAVPVSPAPRAGRALTPQVWKPRLTALAWSSRSLCWPLRGHGPDANLPAQAHWPEGRLTAAQPCCPRGWGGGRDGRWWHAESRARVCLPLSAGSRRPPAREGSRYRRSRRFLGTNSQASMQNSRTIIPASKQ